MKDLLISFQDEADDAYRQYEQQVRRRDHRQVAEPSASTSFKANIPAPTGRREYLDPVVGQLFTTVDIMNRDVKSLHNRYAELEKVVTELKKTRVDNYRRVYPSWWPFKDVSPRTIAFIILWPIIINRVLNMMQRKQR